jgi:hypothetical protein
MVERLNVCFFAAEYRYLDVPPTQIEFATKQHFYFRSYASSTDDWYETEN